MRRPDLKLLCRTHNQDLPDGVADDPPLQIMVWRHFIFLIRDVQNRVHQAYQLLLGTLRD